MPITPSNPTQPRRGGFTPMPGNRTSEPEPIPPRRAPSALPATPAPSNDLAGQPERPGQVPVPTAPSTPTAVPGVPQTPQTAVPATGTILPRVAPSTPTQGPQGPAIPPPAPMVEPANPQGTPGGGAVALTPTNPNAPLTAQTITPGQMADRFALAQSKFDTFVEASDPAYKASLRDANRYGAAQGRLGSGSLRTDFGNLANLRNTQMDTARRGFLDDALEGTIGDAWNEIGLAERQQGFQQGQQDRAFGNEATRLQLEEALRQGDFERAMGIFQAGNIGGTGSGTALSGANTAGNAAGDWYTALQQWMAQRGAAGQAGGTTPAPSAPAPTGTPPLVAPDWYDRITRRGLPNTGGGGLP